MKKMGLSALVAAKSEDCGYYFWWGDAAYNAWSLYFASGNFSRGDNGRHLGQSVRPVRDAK